MNTLAEIKESFLSIKDNLEKRKQWFDDNRIITDSLLAAALNISINAIKTYKSQCGYKSKARNHISKNVYNIDVKESIDVPENWRTNIEWLQKMVIMHNKSDLAKLLNMNREAFYSFLRKRKIFANRRNKYNDKEWLTRYYITLNYPISKIAKIAQVDRKTVTGWLTQNRIPLKYQKKKLEPWVVILYKKLKRLDIIKKVIINRNKIKIFLHNDQSENFIHSTKYKINSVKSYNLLTSKLDNLTPVTYLYESELTGEQKYQSHFKIKDFNKHSKMEKEILKYYMIDKLKNISLRMLHPHNILEKSLYKLKNCNIDRNKSLIILQQFFEYTPASVLNNSDLTRYSIKSLFKIDTLTTNKILLSCNNPKSKKYIIKQELEVPRFTPVNLYIKVFKQLNVKSIIDYYPSTGFKALACAALGIKYYYMPGSIFDQDTTDFSNAVGLDMHKWVDQKADIVLFDNDCNKYTISSEIKQFKEFVKNVVIYSNKQSLNSIVHSRIPKSTINLKDGIGFYGYYVIY